MSNRMTHLKDSITRELLLRKSESGKADRFKYFLSTSHSDTHQLSMNTSKWSADTDIRFTYPAKLMRP